MTPIGQVSITVVEARDLPSKVYYCALKIRSQSGLCKETRSAQKTSAPRWNETIILPITETDTDVRVMICSKKKTYSLGEVIVPLGAFKNLETTASENWYKIIKTTSESKISCGEIYLDIKYKPEGDSEGGIDAVRNMKAVQVNLLRSLQSGPTTAFEQMENAVLEEHGFLTSELKRLTKIEGKESTSATVQNMLEALETTQEELKLKRWMDIQVEDISDCLSQIQKFSKTAFSKTVKSLTEIEDDLVVVSNEMSAIIGALQSKQASTQTESFALLDDILTTDSEKRSFVHGGGVSALLQLLGSADEKIVQKSLEILQIATYFESGRAHRELNPTSVAEVVSGFAQSSNKNHKIYASCVVTNLLHIKDGSIYRYFSEGNGKDDILQFLSSDNSFLQLRTLWGISSMPPGDKSNFLSIVWSKLVAFLKDSRKPEHQAKACAIIANFAYDSSNLAFMASKSSQLLPVLETLLKHSDERSIEALRALANIADSKEIRKALATGECIPLIVKLLDQPLTKVQACWTIGNICMDDRTAVAVRNAGALEKMICLLKDPKTQSDVLEKILWTFSNSMIDEKAKEIISTKEEGLSALVNLFKTKNEKLLSHAIHILCMLCTNNLTVSSALGELDVMQQLVPFLSNARQPHIKDKVCWLISRLSLGHQQNQDAFRKAGGMTDLGDLLEVDSPHLNSATWAMFNLVVENEENLQALKNMDVIQPLVSGLQNEKARDISRQLLGILAADEEQKRKIIDVVVRDVRTRKISFLLN